MRGLESGQLRLAATSSAKYFAPRLLGAFIQRYQGIETSLHIYNRSALLERLRNNEDDLYLFGAPPDQQEVVVQAIVSNPLVVFARSDHPLASQKNLTFARLAEEPFLMREAGSGTRTLILKLFGQHGLTPKIRMELNTDEAIRESILAGLGISILSRSTFGLEPEQTQLVCLDVEGFPLESHWNFVYPVGKHLSAAARAFMDFARVEARGLVLNGSAQRPH
jgi:DNA-binding transcriptional LysR family regulator